MRTKAIILAGGMGSRLKKLSIKVPKPLVKVGGIPVLEHQIRLLKGYGIKHITLVTGYLSEVIEDYFKNGNRFGVKIDYLKEKKPLGTAGGIKELEYKLASNFLVLYGDVMVNMNLGKLLKFHRTKRSRCTLVLHPNDHPYDSDLVEINEDKRITHFYSKPHAAGRYFRNLVSAGIYIISPRIIRYIKKGIKTDFGRDIFPKIVCKEHLFGYKTAEYIKDIGTPARLKQVRKDCQRGKIKRLNSKYKRPAIFLDRDGVINEKAGLLYKAEDFKLLNRAAKAIKKINESDFLTIVITNQPVIARNLCSVEQLEQIHKKMDTLLGREGAKVDAVYYCPHHPDKGYPGENPEYKINCRCRKPKIGMIEKAGEEFNIDMESSFLVGDSYRDILCGKNAGLTTIGLMSRDGCKDSDIEPDYFFEDLYQAIEFIINDPFRPFIEKVNKCFSNSDKQPFVISIAGNSRSGKTTRV